MNAHIEQVNTDLQQLESEVSDMVDRLKSDSDESGAVRSQLLHKLDRIDSLLRLRIRLEHSNRKDTP